MNERHLEPDDPARAAIAELTEAVGSLTSEQELRDTALTLAVGVYLKPDNQMSPVDILQYAESFYEFLSAADGQDE